MMLEQIKRLLIEKNGYSHKEIEEVERRMNIELPAELRSVYLNYGKNKLLNSCNYLTPLRELKIHKGKVFFYKENQGGVVWFFETNEIKKGIIKIYEGYHEAWGIKLIDNSFESFFIKKLVSQCPKALFSSFLFVKNLNVNDELEFKTIFGEAQSNIHYPWQENRKWYWKDMNSIVLIRYEEGQSNLRLYSNSDEISSYFMKKMKERECHITHWNSVAERKKIKSWI